MRDEGASIKFWTRKLLGFETSLRTFVLGATAPKLLDTTDLFTFLNCQRTLQLAIANFQSTNWIVELVGIEPATSWLQTRRSPS